MRKVLFLLSEYLVTASTALMIVGICASVYHFAPDPYNRVVTPILGIFFAFLYFQLGTLPWLANWRIRLIQKGDEVEFYLCSKPPFERSKLSHASGRVLDTRHCPPSESYAANFLDPEESQPMVLVDWLGREVLVPMAFVYGLSTGRTLAGSVR